MRSLLPQAPHTQAAMWLYAWTLALAFMVLATHLSPQLTLTEIVCIAIPVGTVGGAWVFYIVSALINFLRLVLCGTVCISGLVCASFVLVRVCVSAVLPLSGRVYIAWSTVGAKASYSLCALLVRV